jgi:hypothetical protein
MIFSKSGQTSALRCATDRIPIAPEPVRRDDVLLAAADDVADRAEQLMGGVVVQMRKVRA